MLKYILIMVIVLSCNSQDPKLSAINPIDSNGAVNDNFYGIAYVTANLDASVTVNWNPLLSASAYDLFDVTSANPVILTTISAPASSYNLTGLTAGLTSILRLRAKTFDGTMDTNTRDFSVSVPQPFVFTGINSITANSDSTVTVNWTSHPGATAYDLYDVTSSVPLFVATVSAPASTFKTSEFTAGQTISFRLKARRYDGISDLNTTDRSISILEGERFVKLSPGGQHSCGLTGLGNAYCWGANNYGQLGDNTLATKIIPTATSRANLLIGEEFIDIGSGAYHTCGLTNYGKVFCWGYNAWGSLGSGGGNKSVPTAIDMSNLVANESFVFLAIGYQHSCGISSFGSAYCWGDNGSGQLGDNTIISKQKPTQVNITNLLSGERFILISPGDQSSCGVTSLGNTYCWGRNIRGQIGDGTTVDRLIPTALSIINFFPGERLVSTSVGMGFACGLSNLNNAFCWGANYYGSLGINSTIQQTVPTAVSIANLTSGETFNTMDSGSYHSCGTTTKGNTFCWGENHYGDLGLADDSIPQRQLPTAVNASMLEQGEKFNKVFTGWSTSTTSSPTCAITNEGKPYCWGSNISGQLGDGTKFNRFGATPVVKNTLLSGKAFVILTTGEAHTCGTTSTGSTFCWGLNQDGQLGDNSNTNKTIPTPLQLDTLQVGESFISVNAGADYTCGTTSNGNTFCWGANASGQLGDNTTVSKSKPNQIDYTNMATGERFTSLSVGINHTCGITGLANIFCWGAGNSGKLGNGSTTNKSRPEAVSVTNLVSGEKFKSLAVGGAHSCGLTQLGNAYCWGDNTNSQLGVGNNTSTNMPTTTVSTVPLNANERFTTLSAGFDYTCGITSLGRSFCWGGNTFGQLGDTTTVDKNIPSLVAMTNLAAGESLVTIMTGNKITCGKSNLGKSFCWGQNTYGQVGNNTMVDQSLPTQVAMNNLATGSRFSKISSMSASAKHVCGITATGVGACWGYNNKGQLGNDTLQDQLMPTPFIFP